MKWVRPKPSTISRIPNYPYCSLISSIRYVTFHRFLLAIILIAFTWIFTQLAWDLHDGMRTHKADLGQIAQAVWNSSQGRFVEMTDNGPLSTRMTDHVEPVLALISPSLWLWRDVKMLLLLQVLIATIGGWLLYELSVQRFTRLLPPMQRAQIWHLEPLRTLTTPLALVFVVGFPLFPSNSQRALNRVSCRAFGCAVDSVGLLCCRDQAMGAIWDGGTAHSGSQGRDGALGDRTRRVGSLAIGH